MSLEPFAVNSIADDNELARRLAQGDEGALATMMRRYNSRLFRVARAILRDDAEAEDALQEAYIAAYHHVGGFRGGAKLSTWLMRIVINQALARLRKQKRDRVVVPLAAYESDALRQEETMVPDQAARSPESETLRAEVRRLLEQKIDELPAAFRTVFILREVEDMSVEETADCLSIPDATVRTRLFRAKGLLREALAREMDVATGDVFRFAGERCDRMVASVLKRLRQLPPLDANTVGPGGKPTAEH